MLIFKIISAFFYDLLLLTAIWFVSAIPFILWQGPNFEQNSAKLLGFQAYLLSITYVYLTYFWTTTSQTPGLRIWHLKIVRDDDYALTRHNANIRFLLGILLFSIGWITLFLPSKKQTLQDILAHTKIVPIPEK